MTRRPAFLGTTRWFELALLFVSTYNNHKENRYVTSFSLYPSSYFGFRSKNSPLHPKFTSSNVKDSTILLMSSSSGGNFFRRRKSASNNGNKDENEDYHGDLEDDEDNNDEENDPNSAYLEAAASEFLQEEEGTDVTTSPNRTPTRKEDVNKSGGLAPVLGGGKTTIDWGGEYGKLRQRVSDIEEGKTGPANALFRIVTMNSPNEAIANFVKEANPEVVAAMSSAVSSLLGGLSNPLAGMETIVKASKDKLGSLCFQLQMTGYMFRNAEYVLAIKELMNIDGTADIQDYKAAFDRIDRDGSGYIETREIESLLSDVYEGDTPSFEVDAFLNFFDSNKDGKISWTEFEKGIGALSAQKAAERMKKVVQGNRSFATRSTSSTHSLKPGDDAEQDGDEDTDEVSGGEPSISGIVKVEMKDGKVIEVEAKEYIDELKKEAKALKEALQKERGGNVSNGSPMATTSMLQDKADVVGGITGYIASLQGDVQSLTKGISPDVVEAMKRVVDYVVDGGPSGKIRPKDENAEMEIPGSALQQLALWQLVLGYKLREAEATGEYRKIMKQ